MTGVPITSLQFQRIKERTMPTYQYECSSCNHSFDVLQSMIDKRFKKCPACGKNTLQRLIGTGGGIIFKGSGFYETDYKKKEPSKAGLESSSKPQKAVKPACGSKDNCACANN